MENEKLTIADFTRQIDKYFNVFKDYCETFDIDLFNDKFFVDPTDKELTLDREIKQELITYFRHKKEEIREYRYDYFTMKSCIGIEAITGADSTRILAYLERIKHNFTPGSSIKGLSKFGDVTAKTKVKNISSFKILKDFQLIERQLVLSSITKERKERNAINNSL